MSRARLLFALAVFPGCKVCPTDGSSTEPISAEQWAGESAAAVVSLVRHGDPCFEAYQAPTLLPASTAQPSDPCPPASDPCARCIVACDAHTAECGAPTAVYQAALACAENQCAQECTR